MVKNKSTLTNEVVKRQYEELLNSVQIIQEELFPLPLAVLLILLTQFLRL